MLVLSNWTNTVEYCVQCHFWLYESGLGNVEEPKQSTIARVSKELDDAFVNIGFVYLKNHGIDNPTVSRNVLFPSLLIIAIT